MITEIGIVKETIAGRNGVEVTEEDLVDYLIEKHGLAGLGFKGFFISKEIYEHGQVYGFKDNFVNRYTTVYEISA